MEAGETADSWRAKGLRRGSVGLSRAELVGLSAHGRGGSIGSRFSWLGTESRGIASLGHFLLSCLGLRPSSC